MQSKGWPACCGASVLYNFHDCYYFMSKPEKADLIEKEEKALQHYVHINRVEAFLAAILDHKQHLFYKDMMEKNGFELFNTSVNNLHNHKLYLYVRFNHKSAKVA